MQHLQAFGFRNVAHGLMSLSGLPHGKASPWTLLPPKVCSLFSPPLTGSTYLGRTETCTQLNPLREASAQDGRRGEMAVVSRALRSAGRLLAVLWQWWRPWRLLARTCRSLGPPGWPIQAWPRSSTGAD